MKADAMEPVSAREPDNPVSPLADSGSTALRAPELDDRLPVDEYALFASVARVRSMDAGTSLFRRGDLGTSMYVIVSGRVALEFGDDLVAKSLAQAEFFGELGLLIGDHARSADANVTVSGELLEIRHEEFQRLVDTDPALVSRFLRRAIARVVLNEQDLIRRLRRRNQDLQATLDRLHLTTHRLNQTEALTRLDELTGLYNRRGLLQHLEERRRNGATSGLGLVLVDCDRFKRINDEHGHLVGDRVLQAVANLLRSVAGTGDIACRLGGDEFCLLLKADSREELLCYADFVVGTVQGLLKMPQTPPRICSLSVGACLVEPDTEWNHWYARADAGLYRAKQLGGNRVEWQGQDIPTPPPECPDP
ncbi:MULTISPECIES: GGDEF domain-containing protein [Lysobacter]|jgi:diguanylate cyclase (GGDEF)-like protein|uniref:GGDEF domain-containing protein n=1 Tax=Lysobacteraceae TaxID=32033 RepID=UPI000AF13CB8|nr:MULTISPECIES: GGDEF domain-containing protein [Lysobacter]